MYFSRYMFSLDQMIIGFWLCLYLKLFSMTLFKCHFIPLYEVSEVDKHKQVDNVGAGPPKDDGKVYIDGKEEAKVLDSQVTSVFSIYKCDIPLIETQYANSSVSNTDIINTEGIIKLLNQSNPNKAIGPDNISARLLKKHHHKSSSSCSYISSIIISTVYTR